MARADDGGGEVREGIRQAGRSCTGCLTSAPLLLIALALWRKASRG